MLLWIGRKKQKEAKVRIKIADRVLSNSFWHSYLDVVFDFAQHHSDFLSFDIGEIDKIINSAWLSGAVGPRRSYPDILKASARAANRATPSDKTAVLIDDSAALEGSTVGPDVIRVHPYGALVFLSEPFHLIVEDESSDGGFILWMARLLGNDQLKAAYSSGRLLFRHAGGKGQISKSARALSYGVWPRDNRPIRSMKLRAAAILDSDSKYPGHSPNSQICQDTLPHVSFVHILKGRTIENYVPRKYMDRRLSADGISPMVSDFFSLTEDQRNHFPMKKGFRDIADNPQTMAGFLADQRFSVEERNLYQVADQQAWERISCGFGERLGAVYMEPNYRCEPKENNQITPAQKAELEALLKTIVGLL